MYRLPPVDWNVKTMSATKKRGLLELDHLSKRFGKVTVVHEVTLAIPAGSVVALLGPSGCGKTSVLRMIAGFVAATSGRVNVDSQDITDLLPEQRDIGMMFQNYALFPHMTVEANVAFGLRMRKISRAEIRRRVQEVLQLVKMEAMSDRYPSQLSGGQQQRVAFARAIVIEPSLLLLDEPLGALDRNLREGMQEELKLLQRKLGITSVIVTHDQNEALYLADHIAVMNAGRVEQFDAPLTVFDRPKTPFVARFMGISNILPVTVLRAEGDRLVVSLGGYELDALGPLDVGIGEQVVVAIRSNHVTMHECDSEGAGLPGRVTSCNVLGDQIIYHVEVGSQRVEVHAPRVQRARIWSEGETTKLAFDPNHTLAMGE